MLEHIPSNYENVGLATHIPHVVYSHAGGKELTLELILPRATASAPYPLVVFIQGSGWSFPNVYAKLPMFSDFAKAGIAVATIVHRNRKEGFRAPAFLEDAKTAIRFLRANAEKYNLDKTRVAAGGTSSGGNTALLLGQTGDMACYKTDEYPEESDAVWGIYDGSGPSDLLRFMHIDEHPEKLTKGNNEFADTLCGELEGEERLALLREISPERVFLERRVMQPTLIIHGTKDKLVNVVESESLYQTLTDAGCDADLILVDGADHGTGEFCTYTYERILAFYRGIFFPAS